MIAFDELMRRFAELNAAELSRWVENRWVVPETATEEGGERWVFHEGDVARVELILDISHFGLGPLRGTLGPAVLILAGLYLLLRRRPRSPSGA